MTTKQLKPKQAEKNNKQEAASQNGRAHAALQSYVDIYLSLFGISPEPTILFDTEECVIYVNPAFEEVFGWASEELLGNQLDFTPSAYQAEALAAAKSLENDGKITGFHTKRRLKNGSLREFQVSGTLLQDRDEDVIGSLFIYHPTYDSSVQVQAEDALVETLIDQERMTSQLETVAKISTAVSTVLDPQEMLQTFVDLTKEHFKLYQALIFLLNETGDTLEIAAGAGETGQEMVAENRRISLSQEKSLMARAARSRSGVNIKNVQEEPGFLPHPLLPDTLSELAVPLIVGDQLLGVLDVQSEKINHFTKRDIHIQTILASQVAITLQNALLFEQSQVKTAQLEDTTRFLDKVIENLPLGLFVKDAKDLRFTHWNKGNEEVTGLKAEDVLGKNDYDFFSKEQAEFFIAKDREVLSNNTLLDIPEEIIDTPHRGQRVLHTRKIPILDNSGQPRFMLGISEDITERLQKEEEIKLQQTLLKGQSEASPDGILIVTTAREIAFYNQKFVQMWDLPDAILDTLSGQKTIEYVQDKVANVEQFNEMSSYLYDHPEESGNDELTLKDGRIFDRQTSPILNPDGTYYGRVWYFRDITDRKKAQEDIARQAAIMDNAETFIGMGTLEGNIAYVNRYGANLLGFADPQEVVGRPFAEFQPEAAGEFEKIVIPAILEKGSWRGESVMHGIDGRITPVDMTVFFLRDDNGRPIGTATNIIDITERKEAERRLQHQAEIEKLGRAISANFLDLPPEKLNDGIDDALKSLGEFTHADRSYVFLFHESPAGQLMSNTHDWRIEGIESQKHLNQNILCSDWAYEMSYINRLQVLHVPRVADLPAAAAAEKEIYEAEGIISFIQIPLISRGKAIGFLGYDTVTKAVNWNEADIGLLQLVSGIFVSALNRRDANLALEAALSESERLYEMSARLNAATTIEEILETAVLPVSAKDATAANLFTVDLDADGKPEWIEMVAAWQDTDRGLPIPLGSRFYLPEYPGATQWIENPDEPQIINHISEDPKLPPAAKAVYALSGAEATVTLPLNLRGKWIGLLAVSWQTPQNFSTEDARIFKSLAEQTAIMLNNQLLFNETQKRAAELATVAEVGAAITTIRDVNELLQQVVDLTKERFNLYHAHIYLLDNDNLVLTSGAGEIGRQMVAESHAIALDKKHALIALAARRQQSIIVNNVADNSDFLAHPLLPDTKAEMAIPIIVENTVLGVLDVQASQINRFNDDDIRTKSTLAAQIGVALQNARSFARSEQAVQELEDITRQLRREGWESYMKTAQIDHLGFEFSQNRLLPFKATKPQKKKTKESVAERVNQLERPLLIHGESIGNLTLLEPELLTDDAQDIMTAVAERLSAHIENLRLTEQTQRALSETEIQSRRLVVLNEISTELSNATHFTEVYHIAVTRTAELLNADRASLALLLPDGENIQIAAHFGEEMDAPTGTIMPLAGTPIATAMQENRLIAGSPTGKILSTRIVPLLVAGQHVGSLNVGSYVAGFFDERDESLLLQMATILSSIIENIQLLGAAQARAQREQRLREIANRIRGSADVDTIMRTAVQEIGQTLGRQTYLRLGAEREQSTEKDV